MINTIYQDAVIPALTKLSNYNERMDTKDAATLMLAIGLQESNLTHRKQINGPARGLWQFEYGGGFVGVRRHQTTKELSNIMINEFGYSDLSERSIFDMFVTDDVFAAIFARLLLWTDPRSIPNTPVAAFDYYIRVWRPGAYTRGTTEYRHTLRNKFIRGYVESSIIVKGET